MKGKNRILTPEQEREQLIKKKLEEVGRRKRAVKVINNFLKQFPGRSLIQILPVLIRRCSDITVAKVAVERIERNQKLNSEDRTFLEEIKSKIRREECPK